LQQLLDDRHGFARCRDHEVAVWFDKIVLHVHDKQCGLVRRQLYIILI
jgi:hypothetical protein